MSAFKFQNPFALWLLAPWLLAIASYLYFKYHKKGAAIAISSQKIVHRRQSFRTKSYRFLPILRFLAVLFLIIAVARPGTGSKISSVNTEGIDIMISLDLSTSMMGEDFQPNRLEVAKDVVKDFAAKRPNDRIGLVVFAAEPYLQCPLTLEHQMISDLIDEITFESVSEDGTAIGDSLALCASRMKDSQAKTKIILLLTDGVNNRGNIDPQTAARLCSDLGIKIYAVGIGKDGKVPYTSKVGIFKHVDYVTNQFNESAIKGITDLTNGKFYRATSTGILWENINDIDRLEKSKVEVKMYSEFSDKFQIFLLIATILFFLEIILRALFYRKMP